MGRRYHKQFHPHRPKVTSKPVNDISPLLDAAQQKLEGGNLSDALELTRKALSQGSTPEQLDLVAELFVMCGDVEKAVETYKKALSYESQTVAGAYRSLAIFELIGDVTVLKKAVDILRKHKSNPEYHSDFVMALSLLADAHLTHLETPDTLSAQRLVEEALRCDSNCLPALIVQAASYLVMEDLIKAEEAAKHITALFLQEGFYSIEKNAEGEDDLVIHSNSSQPDPQFLISLSRVCSAVEMYDEAAMCCDLILAQRPNDAVALHELAWCYNLMNDYETALTLLQKVREIYLDEGADEEVLRDVEAKIQALGSSA